MPLSNKVGFNAGNAFWSWNECEDDEGVKSLIHYVEQHAEILCKVVKKGKKFFEVPISYNGRTHEEGKKIKFHHIFSVLFRIFFEKF